MHIYSKFQVQVNWGPYSHIVTNVRPIVQMFANYPLYFYSSHTSLVQLATNGVNDVEDDLLFELEMEFFFLMLKGLMLKGNEKKGYKIEDKSWMWKVEKQISNGRTWKV